MVDHCVVVAAAADAHVHAGVHELRTQQRAVVEDHTMVVDTRRHDDDDDDMEEDRHTGIGKMMMMMAIILHLFLPRRRWKQQH